ncbi:MAG: restriction endonuclease subunit S, partial [Chlorobi bacterium CHB2]|nr:restriction endonuclease subunit S [Chlorobi bacterium CHB2]
QQEIVRVLDLFMALLANLQAELVARRKQYQYYRDQLLSFEGRKDVRWGTLGEIAAYSNTRISAASVDANTFVGVDNLLPNQAGRTASTHVPTTGNLTEYQPGDILIGNIRPYLKKIWLATNRGGCSGDVLAVRISDAYRCRVQPGFLYQLLSSEAFFDFDMKHAKGGKMPRGSKAMVLQYPIPIPPLAEQEEIVTILDKFDALVNDLSIGLPAEIAARQKQYEYYRDRLLTFPEAAPQEVAEGL